MKVVGLWVANGNWEWYFAHNKCDIVPTSQKATKVSNQLSWMLALTRNTFQMKKAKTTKPTSLWCDNHFYDSIFTVPWAPSCHFSGWRKKQPSDRNPWKVTRHPKTFRPWFQKKSLFEEAIGVWTYFTSIFTFTGKSTSCQVEQQFQRDAAETSLEELSTKQIKTNVCDKQQLVVKSAHFKDHIFSQPGLRFLFVLSHHCFETW